MGASDSLPQSLMEQVDSIEQTKADYFMSSLNCYDKRGIC